MSPGLPRHLPQRDLQLLKLGGSLITDKSRPHTARLETLDRLAGEIAAARLQDASLQVVLGHGSGSFGHIPASRYGTRDGVQGADGWQGFAEVWREAAELNHLVLAALHRAGLPAIVFPASAAATAQDGRVLAWDLAPLQAALDHGLLPVVYGDVAFDTQRGGTILSTEDIFDYLLEKLRPVRVLLAGIEPGVWEDFPARTRLLPVLSATRLEQEGAGWGASAHVDVTGGMGAKVRQSLAWVQAHPDLEVRIFSGDMSDEVRAALLGEPVGTRILTADQHR